MHHLAKEVENWDNELLSDLLQILVERSNHVPGNSVGTFDVNCPLCQVYAIVNDEMNARIHEMTGGASGENVK